MNNKGELRLLLEQRRSTLSADLHQMKSEQMCERAIQVLKLRGMGAADKQKQAVLAYVPFRSEPKLDSLMKWCWEEGIPLAVPKTDVRQRTMVFYVIESMDQLETTGAWGLREPAASCRRFNETDPIGCILVPGLAFDREKGRLGYGGGYYDRFLSKLQSSLGRVPLTLALAFDLQILPRIPMEEHDYRVDRIITESTTI